MEPATFDRVSENLQAPDVQIKDCYVPSLLGHWQYWVRRLNKAFSANGNNSAVIQKLRNMTCELLRSCSLRNSYKIISYASYAIERHMTSRIKNY